MGEEPIIYYMDEGYLKTVLDVPLLEAAKRNIAVAAIILVEPAAKCVDPDLGALLQHPDYERGVYTMPNMTTLESVNCYAAAFDFLAKKILYGGQSLRAHSSLDYA